MYTHHRSPRASAAVMPARPRFAAALLVASAVALLAAACSDPAAPAGASALFSQSRGASAAGSDFAVLANAAVTCTDGTIVGDVGTFQAAPTGSVTRTSCPIEGGVHVGDGAAIAAYNDFLSAYDALADVPCDVVLTGTLAGVTLAPGVYCFDAAATLTGVLTLSGPANGTWLFKIGTLGTGALTGTNFSVVLAGGAEACDVTWWVSQAATMTDSRFVGSILAGAAITLTRGTFDGNAWSQADVTITGAAVAGCDGGRGNGPNNDRRGCNQGVGNGPEGCDPGNSNHRRPTNDEDGGTPGNPGRTGR